MTEPEGTNIGPDIREQSVPLTTPPEKKVKFFVGEGLVPEIVELPKGSLPMRIVDGVIQLDKDRLNEEKKRMGGVLKEAIGTGNEKLFGIFLRNLEAIDNKESRALIEKLKKAFSTRDPGLLKLDELRVSIATDNIAERNLIREGLRPEISRQPFSFKDKKGDTLLPEDIDFIFVRNNKRGQFKIIIGSKKGIETIGIPDQLPDDKFVPNMMKVEKDPTADIIEIPLKPAADGHEPSAVIVQIKKGKIDLPAQLDLEERESRASQTRTEPDDDDSPNRPPRQQYNPSSSPSPSPRRSWGSYGYTSGG